MQDFLNQKFLGNTVTDYLIAFAIVGGAIILGKILYWVIGRFVKRLTAKTKTKLDDIIVDMVEEPLVFAIILIGLYVAKDRLHWSPGVGDFAGNILSVMVVLCVAWLITRLLDALIEEYLVPLVEKSESDLDDQLLPVGRRIVRIAIWSIAVIVALNNVGYDVGALLAGLGIGGLAFALAAQDTVSNLFGGFTIFTDKPFQVGDRVVVAGVDGFVKEIGVRSTRVQTLMNRIVTIPNSMITSDVVENISSEPNRKVPLTLGLTYDTSHEDMAKGMEILQSIALANPDVEDESICIFDSFGDFSLNILFIYFIKKESDIFLAQSAMNMEILRQFNAAGLDFAFPTQTILHEAIKN